MKILISDYSSDSSTEPVYLNTSLNKAGCRSTILPLNTSIYDGFDISKPDVYITHHEYLSNDLLVYLKKNEIKNLDLIINITGISQENLSKLDSIFDENRIKPAFYFVNHYFNKLTSKTNIISLLHGADLFLKPQSKQYEIDYAVLIDSKEQIKDMRGSYHYLTHDNKIDKISDICMPINRLCHIYHNYHKIIFRYFHGIFTQAFFDSGIRTNAVYFDVDINKETLSKHILKLFGSESFCDFSSPESGRIKEKILNKHTCLHRTKSLLSQLPAREYLDNIQKVIESETRA